MTDYPERQLPDGRWLFVFPLTFGRARLVVGRSRWVYDDGY
jgi:hypothetical protein